LKNNSIRCLLFLLAGWFGPAFSLRAQVNDAGLWTNITLEKRVMKDLDLVFTEEFRFNENITELGTFFTDVGADYRIVKGFKAGLYFRYINKRQLDNSYSQQYRYYSDLSYKQKIKRFEAGYRVRFQVQYQDPGRSETGRVPEWYIRQKLSFAYNTKSRFDPYLSGEIWYGLNQPRSQFDNVRISAGIVTRVTKYQSLDIGYIFQKEFNVVDPETDYIIFIGYKITL
jgi:hypothetical protein